MTIAFNCPKCKFICAFKEIYSGRRARCLKCGQRFIIPQNENEPAKIIKPEKVGYDPPLPGFYKAIYKCSWRAIFSLQSLPILIFIIFLSILKFYTFHQNYIIPMRGVTIFIPVGWILAFFVYGGLFYCFAEIAVSTAFDVEALPEIILGGGFGFIATACISLYSFILALIITLLPGVIIQNILFVFGIKSQWILFTFIALAMFLFPMAIMIISISRDLVLLTRPVYFFTPIIKAFPHYLFLFILFLLAFYLQFESPIYRDVAKSSPAIIYLNLLAAIAIQIVAIVTMRACGLFYRHFACYFKW
jgi:hypothetical protein